MKALLPVLLLLAGCCNAASTYPLEVRLPEPGYRKVDGTLLNFTEFKKTTIVYGTCDPVTEIGEELGRVDVKSWQFKGFIDAPLKMQLCFVAVVIGLDDQPMGRSTVARFNTGSVLPKKPQVLKIG